MVEPLQGADRVKRMFALMADLLATSLIFWFLDLFLPRFLAWFGAGTFFLLRDAMPISALQGASPGKKLFGLAAFGPENRSCDFKTSAKRNVSLLIGPVLYALVASTVGYIPLLGWIPELAALALCVLILAVECLEVWHGPGGKRVGDLLADTTVVEVDNLSPEVL